MTTTNLPLYRFMVQHGASEKDAEAAAISFDPLELATKGDLQELNLGLRRDLAELEARLAWKIGGLVVGAMVSTTGLFALIVGWLVKHP